MIIKIKLKYNYIFKLINIFLIFACFAQISFSQALPVVKSRMDDPNSWKKKGLWTDCTPFFGAKCTASSTLNKQGNITYAASNLEDGNANTIWAEGIKGDGIGEYFEITEGWAPGTSQKDISAQREGYWLGLNFTDAGSGSGLLILNGYQRDSKTFKENSRIKQFKVYLNKVPICLLNLLDAMGTQAFDLPLPKLDEKPKKTNLNTIRFEITQVYKGTKYDDACISEIWHTPLCCIAKGSEVKLFNGSSKEIDKLTSADTLLGINQYNQNVALHLDGVEKIIHDKGLMITTESGRNITISLNHPIYTTEGDTFVQAQYLQPQQTVAIEKDGLIVPDKIIQITPIKNSLETYHLKGISAIGNIAEKLSKIKLEVNGILTTEEMLLKSH